MTAGEFKEKYLPLGEPLYRVAFYMLESGADAEDAVQDLFVRLWSSRDSLDSVRNPKAYCITMLRNICIDRMRAAASSVRTEELRVCSPQTIYSCACFRTGRPLQRRHKGPTG